MSEADFNLALSNHHIGRTPTNAVPAVPPANAHAR